MTTATQTSKAAAAGSMPTATTSRRTTDGAQDLVTAALWYGARGWHVFPLAPGSKRPAVEAWETAATTDPDRIRAEWAHAEYNIGIACGPSGLLVVDLDMPKDPADTPPAPWDTEPGIRDGADVLATLAEQAGQSFPFGTFQVQTASGGIHLYFTQPPGQALRNTTARLGWKIDTRGHGGYVVAAGSVVDGRRYTTLHAIRPAPLPGWLADALIRRPGHRSASGRATVPTGAHSTPLGAAEAYAHAALRGELARVLAARPGERNDTLNAAAYALGQLAGARLLDPNQVTAALTVAATHIGLSDTEAARTIASGLDSGAQHPRTDPRTDPRRTA